MRVHVVDHGAGNLRSVVAAIERAGGEPAVARTAAEVLDAARLVLPGVGAAGHAMDTLRARGLDEALTRAVREHGRPLLGICVGMQVMAEKLHEHGEHDGLGWIPGAVRALRDFGVQGGRVPHTGWNDISPTPAGEAWFGRPGRDRLFYFNHGFALQPGGVAVAATVQYGGVDVPAAIQFGSVIAVQFHPEKSQLGGQSLLERFLDWRP